ncbi:unnamed protein product [Acanthosepion pharaonis]|uniref:Uncharacterized protein n=1 Tax=Acanthosepion pharaonis TaxID=158019 RepID=A0A812D0G2_ACAPH|nr:unnamed protein product [Sepia pharaonis]
MHLLLESRTDAEESSDADPRACLKEKYFIICVFVLLIEDNLSMTAPRDLNFFVCAFSLSFDSLKTCAVKPLDPKADSLGICTRCLLSAAAFAPKWRRGIDDSFPSVFTNIDSLADLDSAVADICNARVAIATLAPWSYLISPPSSNSPHPPPFTLLFCPSLFLSPCSRTLIPSLPIHVPPLSLSVPSSPPSPSLSPLSLPSPPSLLSLSLSLSLFCRTLDSYPVKLAIVSIVKSKINLSLNVYK